MPVDPFQHVQGCVVAGLLDSKEALEKDVCPVCRGARKAPVEVQKLLSAQPTNGVSLRGLPNTFSERQLRDLVEPTGAPFTRLLVHPCTSRSAPRRASVLFRSVHDAERFLLMIAGRMPYASAVAEFCTERTILSSTSSAAARTPTGGQGQGVCVEELRHTPVQNPLGQGADAARQGLVSALPVTVPEPIPASARPPRPPVGQAADAARQ
eukprot:Hpha_TRINITY_DN20731_c0_g1::TRINITY_DN20731_c0_g1_i1::g.33355::m.33355